MRNDGSCASLGRQLRAAAHLLSAVRMAVVMLQPARSLLSIARMSMPNLRDSFVRSWLYWQVMQQRFATEAQK